MAQMHEVDYRVIGDDLQFVELELDPQEASVAEAGGMMYMDDGIEMETIFGDGSQSSSGLLGSLVGAGKRLLTGESLFMTVFVNTAPARRRVAFGAPYPGKIVPVRLSEIGAAGQGQALRVAVEGGGCAGFQYDIRLDTPKDDDLVIESGGEKVLIDPVSLPFLTGAVIDFADELIGARFVIDNPNASSSCGCGTSFSI